MIGVEIDMIVKDSLKALKMYETIFAAQRVEATSYRTGLNEAVFTIYGTRFHLLDENPDFQMFAPKPEDPKSVWLNIVVPDIREVWDKAIQEGCKEIQPVTEMEEMGIINAMFADPFGYIFMLHEVVKEVSFEERCRIMEEKLGSK